ncbi:MAG: hypothetical protein WD751_11790 [Anaerolineales bacterium]
MTKTILIASLLVGLGVVAIPTLAAANMTADGIVTAIDGVAGTFDLQAESGDTYTVNPPDDFDLASLSIGARAQVRGSLDEGVITASRVALLAEDDGESASALDAKDGFYCRTASARHPALNNLATQYDEPYADLLHYFCEWRFGVGEIKLALQTADALNDGTSFGQILELKRELGGWGQVWQHYGVKGGGKK